MFDAARAQLPELPQGLSRLVRADTAGATHDFLNHVVALEERTGKTWRFSVGFAITGAVRDVIRALEDGDWTPATRQNGQLRDKAYVAEITGAAGIDISGWPAGSRLLVRKEPLHPGAQQTIEDIDGCRFTAFLTDQTDPDLARLDTRHRGHARVEDRIRGGKDTGMRTLPCDTFARNALWLQLVLTAQDLMDFTQLLTLEEASCAPPNPNSCVTSCCTPPHASSATPAGPGSTSSTTGPGPTSSSPRSTGSGTYPHPPTHPHLAP